MLFGTRESFAYLRCPTCGLMRIAQVPDDLARHYPAAYYDGSPPPVGPARGWLGRRAERARNRLAFFRTGGLEARLLRGRAAADDPDLRATKPVVRRAGLRSFDDPILDVGCGRVPGQLLRLRHVGFRKLMGVDPFLDGDADIEGIALRRQSIHDIAGSFQFITLHHSFEHVPDPLATLRSAARLLRPGGVLMIRTPVMGTWFWETFGTSWWELDPPRHLFVFSQSSLERLASAAGLTIFDTVWDSAAHEILASEQIRRDIAWREPASWNVQPPGPFDAAFIARAGEQVKELNGDGRAGRAGFYLRAASPAATLADR